MLQARKRCEVLNALSFSDGADADSRSLRRGTADEEQRLSTVSVSHQPAGRWVIVESRLERAALPKTDRHSERKGEGQKTIH